MFLAASSLPVPAEHDFNAVLWSLVALASVAAIFIGLAAGWKSLRSKDMPQPFVTSKAPRVALWEELEAVRRSSEETRQRMEAVERGMNKRMDNLYRDLNASGEDRATKLHNRLNDVLATVSDLAGFVRGKFEKHQ